MKFSLTVFRLLLLITFSANYCFASDINLKITFKDSVNFDKLQIIIDDGLSSKTIDFKKTKKSINISKEVYATYGTVEIILFLNNKTYNRSFWIKKDIRSSIAFLNHDLKNYQLENVLEMYKGKIDALNNYSRKELTDFVNASIEAEKTETPNSAALRNVFQKAKDYNAKKLEYVKNTEASFYTLYVFEKHITEWNTKAELMEIYNLRFAEKFSHYFEARQALNKINGYGLKDGEKSPQFKTTDITGKQIDLSKTKSQFVLINFWATWCKPCIEEIPVFVGIRNKYTRNELEIISVCTDANQKMFLNIKKKMEMNWTHVFNQPSLKNTFGINTWPTTFLINKEGEIIHIVNADNIDKVTRYLEQHISPSH